jgi:hypothetical protein
MFHRKRKWKSTRERIGKFTVKIVIELSVYYCFQYDLYV